MDEVPYVARGEPVSRVRGEVYEADDAFLSGLNEFEEHPRVCRRELVQIELDSGRTLAAWLYFHPKPSGRFVPSGDFFDARPPEPAPPER